ncbi:MAG: hypothetical protein KGD59_01635 [Candidatus Heimdallarchaeota archaeon]|jgi:hypothetical protein|nr:hypothetical protein [Candidatus Heimdallarchaeota archaeon]MBY8993222.1 hypothetical protein [Candidatus Heimdallarchaeota archaeon]
MKLELVNEPLKVVQTIAIADLEDTMVTVGKRSRIFPVVETRDYETIGYYITGDIYLGADTIVNTKKGAIGEPIEKLAKEAFIKCDSIDLSNTKSENLSDKDFRNIELTAYRYFQKIHDSQFSKHGRSEWRVNGKRYSWPKDLKRLDFYIYLFEPEEFILIKEESTIIAIGKDDKEVIVCDKKKNSYVEVSKKEGVKVSNDSGEVVKTSSAGVMINGKSLNDILSGALRPLSEMFNGKRKF